MCFGLAGEKHKLDIPSRAFSEALFEIVVRVERMKESRRGDEFLGGKLVDEKLFLSFRQLHSGAAVNVVRRESPERPPVQVLFDRLGKLVDQLLGKCQTTVVNTLRTNNLELGNRIVGKLFL